MNFVAEQTVMGERMTRWGWLAALLLLLPTMAMAQQNYTAQRNGDVVQLRDARTDTLVSVLLPVNNAYEMVVKGKNVLRMTIRSLDEMRARPGLNGVSLLWPFANRIDGQAFWANGKKYNFDMELGNVRGAVPIHGYLSGTNAWQLVEARADAQGAWVTSRLDFYKHPDFMKQFPFAHTLTLTYRLSAGVLEVRMRLDNLATEPMPLMLGWHPYFALADSGRASWTLSVPAKTRWLLNDAKLPTGESEPSDRFFGGDRRSVPLSRFSDRLIDDVFSDFDRESNGRATVSIRSNAGQAISVSMGPKYNALVLYSTVPAVSGQAPAAGRGGVGRGAAPAAPPPVSAGPAIPLTSKEIPTPPERGFVAIEPYTGITNAFNLAQRGVYKDLQSVAPGGSWEESFWISTSGY